MSSDIQILHWDSNFFNKKIGKLCVLDSNKEYMTKLVKSNFDLVYVFSNNPLNLKEIDIKVTYTKTSNNQLRYNNVEKFNIDKHSYDELLNLVYLSGHESRFRKDPLIQDLDFKKLYQTWLNNLLSDSKSNVLISVFDKKIVGFIGFSFNIEIYKIDLFAVDELYQKKGIGKNLLNAVEAFADSRNIISVQTQLNNKKACNFYKKHGFTEMTKEYIYHFWR